MTMQSSSYPSAPTHSTPSYPPPPATGIPVSSTNQFSSDKPAPTHFQSHPPPPFQISQTNQEALVPWSTGLCDCFDDCGNCCLTYWCPCVTFGHTSEIVDRGTSSCGSNGALYVLVGMFTGCPCIYSCFYRTKLRKLYKIEGDGCCDCLTHTFCGVCALTQEYRELEKKGFDMSLGWHDNMERQNKVVTPPMVQGGMQR